MAARGGGGVSNHHPGYAPHPRGPEDKARRRSLRPRVDSQHGRGGFRGARGGGVALTQRRRTVADPLPLTCLALPRLAYRMHGRSGSVLPNLALGASMRPKYHHFGIVAFGLNRRECDFTHKNKTDLNPLGRTALWKATRSCRA